uniref:Fungal-type protein kinase domain-containing protein n=2 Tax=Schizophyllum commune (strain H4-8 / FGSC 9210) TaxID=578458 RepID=D8Q2U6_SCHCM
MAGRPLKEFESKEEFLQALRDTIYAHKHLFYPCHVLQCNINDMSIMLHRPPSKSRRWGTLVDLGHASPTGADEFEGSAFVDPRVGSSAFIACRLVPYMSSGCRQTPRHDFESYIHLLMYMCASYSGPSNTPRDNFDIRQSPMAAWFNGASDEKFRIMFRLDDGDFRAFLDSLFDPYFDDLKDLVCELRTHILRTPDVTPNHYSLLRIFDRHIAALQAPPPLPEPAPAARQRVLDIPTVIETKRKGIVKRKRPSAPPAAQATTAAAAPTHTPVTAIATPVSPAPLTITPAKPAPSSPTSAVAPSGPAAPSPPAASSSTPPPPTTSRTTPLSRQSSRPMTRAMKRRLADSRTASPPSDDSDRTLVDTTPERKCSLPDSPSPKRKSPASPSLEDRKTSSRRSKRLASPDTPSDEPPLHATRASKRRKVA